MCDIPHSSAVTAERMTINVGILPRGSPTRFSWSSLDHDPLPVGFTRPIGVEEEPWPISVLDWSSTLLYLLSTFFLEELRAAKNLSLGPAPAATTPPRGVRPTSVCK